MDDTVIVRENDDRGIVRENIEIVDNMPWYAVSWGAAIAGALCALAVSFLIIALGSGIGLAVASPYGSGPSATALTIAGAVWLVLAQSFGFAAGGFVAGRLRADRPAVTSEDARFRDGVHGFIAWTIGVMVMTLLLVGAAANTARTVAAASSTATPGSAGSTIAAAADPTGYFVDALLRPDPAHETAQTSNPQSTAMLHEQVARILGESLRQGQLAEGDRTYLAQVVASQTGLSAGDAQKRVDDVFNRAKQNARNTADTALKAASYLSFWTFMSLLFGAVAAALGGIMGGERREDMAVARPGLAP